MAIQIELKCHSKPIHMIRKHKGDGIESPCGGLYNYTAWGRM